MYKHYLITITFAFTVVGCSESENNNDPVKKQPSQSQHMMESEPQNKMNRKMDFAQITRGGKVFQKNCLSCHGANAEGHPNWRKRNADNTFPAPPLNGSGHAWHHTNAVNKNTIANGTKHLGGNMPAWKDKLTEQEINDVISWFQSKWPDKVYQTWSENFKYPK